VPPTFSGRSRLGATPAPPGGRRNLDGAADLYLTRTDQRSLLSGSMCGPTLALKNAREHSSASMSFSSLSMRIQTGSLLSAAT